MSVRLTPVMGIWVCWSERVCVATEMAVMKQDTTAGVLFNMDVERIQTKQTQYSKKKKEEEKYETLK